MNIAIKRCTAKSHEEAHQSLDRLVGCFLGETHRLPSQTTVMELIKWSYAFTEKLKREEAQGEQRPEPRASSKL